MSLTTFSIAGPRQVEFCGGVGRVVAPGLGRSISTHHFAGPVCACLFDVLVFGLAGGEVGLGGMEIFPYEATGEDWFEYRRLV